MAETVDRLEEEPKTTTQQRNRRADALDQANAQIAALLKLESADKARQERIKAIHTRIAAIVTEIERIQKEIAQIEGPEKVRITAVRQERLEAYVAYFENQKQEQKTLEELYTPVTAKLKSESASPQEQDLEFSIRWEADLDKWLERGGVLFDQRRAIPYGTAQGLGDAARRILAPAWMSGDRRGSIPRNSLCSSQPIFPSWCSASQS